MKLALAALASAALLHLGCSSPKCDEGATCQGSGGMSYGGAAGASTGGAGSPSTGGSAAGQAGSSNSGGVTQECPPECLVAIKCVTQCGGDPVSLGCCPCVDPAFDARTCM